MAQLASGPIWPLIAQRLELSVTSFEAGRTLYRGSLATMPPQALGTIAPGESRTYELGARLLANAEPSVAGTSVSVLFRWTTTEAAPTPTPAPPVTPCDAL